MLGDALNSLIYQETDGKFSYEIVVIDNASTDETKAVVRQVASNSPVPIRYIFHKEQGIAQAQNRGVMECREEWIAIFDDDELAERDWLKQLYSAVLQTGAPIVGGAVLLDLPPEELSSLGRLRRLELREIQYYDDLHQYTGKNLPGSGNVLIARRVFNHIGLFDTSMMSGGADTDFFLKAKAANLDMWYTPKAVIRHRIPPNRLTERYFRWDAVKVGASFAYLDFKHKGQGKMLFFCMARIGQALLINLPLLMLGWVRRDRGEFLGRKSLLWRAEGYIRKTLSLIAPSIFSQKYFFSLLELHKGRSIEKH
jgi:GT2 family glycosyltransferase